MSDLMRDDVSLREIAGSTEPVAQHFVKAEIDVNAPILRAIKRSACTAGKSAAGAGLIGEENELRFLILAAHLAEDIAPCVFGIGQDDGDEFRCFIARRGGIDLSGWRYLRLLLGINERLRVAAEQEVSDDKDDPAETAPDCDLPAAPGTADVLDIFAFPLALPEHRPVGWCDPTAFTSGQR